MKSNCKWCGNEYIKKYGRLYCSEKCKNDAKNESKKITGLTLEQKKAIIFYRNKTDLGDDKIASILGVRRARVQGFKTSIQAKEMGITDYGLKSRNNKTGKIKPEEEYEREFNKKFKGFKYIGGYENSDKKVKIQCLKCASVFERYANVVSPSQKNSISCKSCNEDKKSHKELEKELKRISWRLKHIQKEIEYKKSLTGQICIECGEEFVASRKNQKYCSNKCNNKANRVDWRYTNKLKNKRFQRALLNGNGNYDYITLEELVKRDGNICHICGDKIDYEDYTYSNNSHFIVGPNYPSIDHVVPISKGGAHIWKNVKLAHHYCNTLKSNKII